jgi:hypothetical protein
VFWFDSRPKQSAFDLYGGKLDGLHMRITLDKNYQPLMLESMHNCGCYHKFYPRADLVLKEGVQKQKEPPFVAQHLPEIKPNQKLVVRISSGEHYVQDIRVSDEIAVTRKYSFESYDALRNLPAGNGEIKSLFAPDGIVKGTERLESLVLWPMGVKAPGAMRQRGRHVIAFAGERYFDDPLLLEENFTAAMGRASDRQVHRH